MKTVGTAPATATNANRDNIVMIVMPSVMIMITIMVMMLMVLPVLDDYEKEIIVIIGIMLIEMMRMILAIQLLNWRV